MSNPTPSLDKAIVTCALTGVLTDPRHHPVPVTAGEMAAAARQAYDAGAAVVHVHFRRQEPGQGHLPSWNPDVAATIVGAIRDACPGILINMSTGVVGADVSGPLACLERLRPEIAACNAGSLNYLKTRRDGSWAWPPMLFDNPVAKIETMLAAMAVAGTRSELECFDVGIVRSVGLFVDHGMITDPQYNFVTGVASGMPADADLLELLLRYVRPGARWQATVIGRREVWPFHRRAAELGGDLRTGLEDTFYLPSGERAGNNGELIEALVSLARQAGREIASANEVRGLSTIAGC
ncbi:MAG: 3-keto-5-aminohexanoate cleavage protein [Thermoanaerobaculia bacterium]